MLPFKLRPYYKQVLWGGTFLNEFKNVPPSLDHIGESWEVSAIPGCESVVCGGEMDGMTLAEVCALHGRKLLGTEGLKRYGGRFPLLVKFIDAAHCLSLQVHPGKQAAATSKDEVWYILQTRPGANVQLGLKPGVDRSALSRAIGSGDVCSLVEDYPSQAGDVFHIPSGQIHGLGAGNFLLEIQQPTDVTYRIYDYNRLDSNGRPRELHTAQALEALDFDTRLPGRSHPEGTRLISTDVFTVDRFDIRPGVAMQIANPTVTSVICVDGELSLSTCGDITLTLARGDSAVVPASCEATLRGHGKAIVITP